MLRFFRIAFTLLFFITFITIAASAQTPVDPCTDPIDGCPIDNGVVLLIIAAIVIAAKKTYDYKKPENKALTV